MLAHAAHVCLGQADGPVIARLTILTSTLGGSREAVWGGLSLLSMASWWLQGPSFNVCPVPRGPASLQDWPFASVMVVYSSWSLCPGGILSNA